MKTFLILVIIVIGVGFYANREYGNLQREPEVEAKLEVSLKLDPGEQYFIIANIPAMAAVESAPILATRSGIIERKANAFVEQDASLANYIDPMLVSKIKQAELALARLEAGEALSAQKDASELAKSQAALKALENKIALVQECSEQELHALAKITGGDLASLKLETLTMDRDLLAAQIKQRSELTAVTIDERSTQLEIARIGLEKLVESGAINAPFKGKVDWKVPFNSEGRTTVAEGMELGSIRKSDGYNLIVRSNDARLATSDDQLLYYQVYIGSELRHYRLRARTTDVINSRVMTSYEFQFNEKNAEQYIGSVLNGSVVALTNREYVTASKMNVIQVTYDSGARTWRDAVEALDGYRVLHEGVDRLALIKE